MPNCRGPISIVNSRRSISGTGSLQSLDPEARVLGGDGANPFSALVPDHLHEWNDLGG